MLPVTSELQEIKRSTRIFQSQSSNYTAADRYLWIQPGAKYTKNIYSGSLQIVKDRICGGFQYIPQFALYEHAKQTEGGKLVNVIEVVRMMKGLALKRKCDDIKHAKEIGDDILRKKLKESLPYITHTGVFLPRRNEGLQQPAFTFQLDIDKVSNPDEILFRVIDDKELNILFASKSVSGNGVKALLFLKEIMFLRDEWTPESYRQTYHKATEILSAYFASKYRINIDTQMKSISQPFFLYYSPDLFINKNIRLWV